MIDLGNITFTINSGPSKKGAQEVVQAVSQINEQAAKTQGALRAVQEEQRRAAAAQREFALTILNAGNDLEKASRKQSQ